MAPVFLCRLKIGGLHLDGGYMRRFSRELFLMALLFSCAGLALAEQPEAGGAAGVEGVSSAQMEFEAAVADETLIVEPDGGDAADEGTLATLQETAGVAADEALAEQSPEDIYVVDAALVEVRRLMEGGTPGLALRIIDTTQPSYSRESRRNWLEWESERLGLYERLGDWQGLVARIQEYPDGLPPEFLAQAATRQASALQVLGQPVRALQVLRALIWNAGNAEPEQLAQWRRMVIRCYLMDGLAQDAYIAMLRYQQDYDEADDDWRLLRARVLLQVGRDADARALLQELPGFDAMILNLLAGLRAGSFAPQQVIDHARQILSVSGYSGSQRMLLWNVVGEAAQKSRDHALRIDALEHALALRQQGAAPDNLFDVHADQLWALYQEYAQVIGNERLLLVGDDAAWYDVAQSLSGQDKLRARALYAYLALNGIVPTEALIAHQNLSYLLRELPHGDDVLHQLYLGSGLFGEVMAIPSLQRYQLAEKSLARGDFPMASRLMSGLDRPPAETDDFQWDLRRARVHVMAGNYSEGHVVLQSRLHDCQTIAAEQLDQLMQVLFDLQSADQHGYAYPLFEAVLGCAVPDDLRREILYWMADSKKALGHYDEAAFLYLRSAGFHEPDAMDMWAQSARYQAGEMLAQYGLLQDARRVYEGLLAVTEDQGRRALLQRHIQQLWQTQP